MIQLSERCHFFFAHILALSFEHFPFADDITMDSSGQDTYRYVKAANRYK